MEDETKLSSIKSAMNEKLEDEVLKDIISALRRIDQFTRGRILKAVIAHLDIPTDEIVGRNLELDLDQTAKRSHPVPYSEERTISPKDFMVDKSPKTDIERIICLAYYLTHYRNKPHFKNSDLSMLNTEAAQIKFSNAAVAVDNAVLAGLLTASIKGNKQITTYGERYVQALPDREEAKLAIASARRRKKSKKGKKNISGDS